MVKSDHPAARHAAPARKRRVYAFGLLLLLGGLAVALLLVLDEFAALDLPEPGESPCSHAIANDWDRISHLPISFIGLAYWAAFLVAWVLSKGRVPSSFRYVARAGAALSVGCAAVAMAMADGRPCIYWSILHAGNLGFWLLMELSSRRVKAESLAAEYRVSSLHSAVTLGAVFALVLALLNVAKIEQRQRMAASQLAARQKAAASPPAGTNPDQVLAPRTSPKTQAARATSQPASPDDRANTEASPGESRRHLLGSPQAPVKVTLFVDYQSEHSAETARRVQELFHRHGDLLSVSVRHYPRCTDCNYSQKVNLHPNACQAAKAAEAAGILKGNPGFWQMHGWLLERRGSFTAEELTAGLRKLGYDDIDQFVSTMESREALRHVLRDIVDAESLLIKETPMVLINGERVDDEQPAKAILAAIQAVRGSPTSSPAAPTDWLPVLASAELARGTFSEELQGSAITATARIVNNSKRSVGSGVVFAIRPPFAYILTAYHVVASADSFEVQTFSAGSYPQASRRFPGAQVIATSAAADLALVRIPIDNARLHALPLCPLESLPEPQRFVALSTGCTGEEAPTCQLVRVIDSKTVRKEAGSESRKVWEVGDDLATGRSGGPLIDRQGRIFGIASGNSQGRGYYGHTAEIHEFLANSALKWLLTEIDPSFE